MKILQVFKTSQPESIGGVETYIDQICCELPKYGIKSDIFTLSKDGVNQTIDYNGYHIHLAKRSFTLASTGFSLDAIRFFREISAKYDIIHYHFPWPYQDLLYAFGGVGKPALVTYHSDIVKQKWLFQVYKPLMHWFLNQMQYVLTTSENYQASSTILSKVKVQKITLPLFTMDTANQPISKDILNQIKCKYGERFFLFVGALRYYKGLQYAIEAVRGTDIPLVIVGEGSESTALKHQAHGIKNVYFTGSVDEETKANLYAACYGFVFPSHLRSEAFGLALLEAAMYGKPMISCEIGTGTSFINIAGETGVVVQPKNSMEIRHAMSDLFNNQERAYQYGMNARKRYLSVFSAASHFEKLVSIYRNPSSV